MDENIRRCGALVAGGRGAVAWRGRLPRRLAAAALALCLGALPGGCRSDEAVLLLVRAPAGTAVRRYDLVVQDRRSREVLYRSGEQQVDPEGDTGRALGESPLRLGLLLPRRGSYFLRLRAAEGPLWRDGGDGARREELFFAALFDSQGATELDAPLSPVPPAFDDDGDHFPDAATWPQAVPEAARYRDRPELLDCVDRDPAPGAAPLPGGLRAAEIHPLAALRCGLPLDSTCGGARIACVDRDGDGDPEGRDCDDEDPRRYHGNPRPRNCCQCTDRASCRLDHRRRQDLASCAPARCDSDFDFDCTGQAVDCFVDEDCDGYSPSDRVPGQRDCDDGDPRVHPGADKDCQDPSKDWACDGNPRGGCVDCDLDGDGYERRDDPAAPGAHCPDGDDRHPGQRDCDDEDRGVFPGSTRHEGATLLVRDLDGNEGGTVAAALRGLCRNQTPGGAPQDADCDGEPRRGCPGAGCDGDGDGFPSAAAGCNPRGLATDCNDDDPRTFPGAPDRCGDGKAQNCSTDRPCFQDDDGDGYRREEDCDDGEAAVHPFARELCNGRDDDCDGLIDELNPGPGGGPERLVEEHLVDGALVRSTTSCSDLDVGECGARLAATGGKTGRCVCTAVLPSTRHAADGKRTACPGTNDGPGTAPRCFFARGPAPQSCDADRPRDDDCDGRDDAPDGKNLADYGAACGVSTGECRAGTVVGCDRGQVNPFSAAAGRAVRPPFPASQRHLVCSDRAVAPRDELCNGRDDDCDGALPGAGAATPLPQGDEADHDGDKRLACGGCGGQQLAEGLLGCDDCDDLRAVSYPGAKELCDGRDNGCAGAGYEDGADDCEDAPATSCCAGTPQCVDVLSDPRHCGGCGKACAAPLGACAAGACVECTKDEDCKDPLKPACTGHVCG